MEGSQSNLHRQVLRDPLPFSVDEEMWPLISALWVRGYDTLFSCQEVDLRDLPSTVGMAEVGFSRAEHLQKLVAVAVRAAQLWGDDGLHGRITGDLLGGGVYRGEGEWRVAAHIASTKVHKAPAAGLHPFMFALYLPREDVPRLVQALEDLD